MNEETLDRSTMEKGRELQWLSKQRRYAAVLWCNQVDAADGGEMEAKLDDGGRARDQRRRKEEEEAKGEKENGLWAYL